MPNKKMRQKWRNKHKIYDTTDIMTDILSQQNRKLAKQSTDESWKLKDESWKLKVESD